MKNLGTICLLLALSFFSLPARADESLGLKLKTVVLDPGHGGKDAGAVSKDRKTYEKNLVLSIAKATEKKIKEACPEVKVVLTRRNDVFLPLLERAEIANRNKANLFISIHVNASTKTSPSGFSAHILGESQNPGNDVFGLNMNVSKRENSVVMLEEDYSVKYKGFDPSDPASAIVFNLIQSAYYEQSLYFAGCMDGAIASTHLARRGVSQDNFYVLWRTSMPAVLLECGFISNEKDLSYLKTKEGIDEIASAICDGFLAFKKNYETTVATAASEPAVPAATPATDPAVASVPATAAEPAVPAKPAVPATVPATAPAAAPQKAPAGTYGIQVLVSASSQRNIAGYPDAQAIKDGRFYKYIVGRSDSIGEVKKMVGEVKKKYPDSFVVTITENGISPYRN